MGATVTSARVAGALLVERGLVTPTQLAEALEHQRAHGGELEELLPRLFGLARSEVVEILEDTKAAQRVDIGALLYANGAVGLEGLADARQRSIATGQPLGPILVEMGAISRLDLASALADQWADSPAQILPSPAGRHSTAAPPEGVDDLRFAMAALEESMRAARESDGDAGGFEEVLRREEALVARIAALEHAIDQPIEADPALVTEIHGIGESLDALRTSLGEVATADEVEALREAVGDAGELRDRLSELALQVEGAATKEASARLATRVDEASAAIAEVERLAESLDELRSAIASVEGMPERLAAVEQASARVEELASSIESAQADLVEMAGRPVGDPGLAERVDALALDTADAVEALEANLATAVDAAGSLPLLAADMAATTERIAALEALHERVDSLRGAIEGLEQRPLPDEGLAERVEALARRVETLSIEALGPAAEAAVADVAVRVEALAAAQSEATAFAGELDGRLQQLRDELSTGTDRGEQTARLDELATVVEDLVDRFGHAAPASDLVALVAAVEELQSLQGPHDQRVTELDRRVAEIESQVDHARRASDEAIDLVRDRLEELGAEASSRLDSLVGRIDLLETDATGGGRTQPDPGLRAEVEQLGDAVDSVRASVAASLERLEHAWADERASLRELVAGRQSTADPGESVVDRGGAASPSAPGLAALERTVERLSDRVVEQERSLVEHFSRREKAMIERLGAGTDVGQQLKTLSRGFEELRVRVERAASTAGGAGAGGVSGEELDELRETLFGRLEKLASSIDWRFQRLEGGPGTAAAASDLQARVDHLSAVVQRLEHGAGDAAAPS